uniref:Arylsulfatase J-like n=1 Tax=Saccoglossus kowalevskii TaxID=10224 RepID=A0ABM0MAU1_SACKO|nr:PREDICTED: arylsulfatase J-like [Saccoglossus kowalevskii]
MGGGRLDGYNQWETISQGTPSLRTEILLNIDPLYTAVRNLRDDPWAESTCFNVSMRAAIRVGDWKLITGGAGNGSWIPPTESGIAALHPERRNGRSVQLYNVHVDPYERMDYSHERPDIAEELLQRLGHYYRTSVPPNFPQQEVRSADPANYGGVWSPWA